MLRTRMVTAAILGPIVVAAAWFGEPWLALLLGVIAFLSLTEVIALLDAGGFEPPQVLGLVAGLAVTAAGIVAANVSLVGGLLSDLLRQTDPPGLVTITVAAAMILLAAVAFTRADARAGFLSWAMTSFGILYVGPAPPLHRPRRPPRACRRLGDHRCRRTRPSLRIRVGPAPHPGGLGLRHRRVPHRSLARVGGGSSST